MKSLKTIAEKRLGGQRKGFSIMKGFFRLSIEADKVRKHIEYAPCLEGALPAFLHTAKNVEKFLDASYRIHQNTRIHRQRFDSTPYKEEFGNVNISDDTWQHAFNAANVSIKCFKGSVFETENFTV